MTLYIIGFTTFGATIVFYIAIFPRLARNTAHVRYLREKHRRGEITVEEYELEESMETNRISNLSTVSQSSSTLVIALNPETSAVLGA